MCTLCVCLVLMLGVVLVIKCAVSVCSYKLHFWFAFVAIVYIMPFR